MYGKRMLEKIGALYYTFIQVAIGSNVLNLQHMRQKYHRAKVGYCSAMERIAQRCCDEKDKKRLKRSLEVTNIVRVFS